MAHDDVKPVGLAARDSLRLEMGYPLYGHDIDDTTSPIEADISWIMGKHKNNKTFIGAERVLAEIENGASRVRVGVKLTGRGVAREGAEIRNDADEKIGVLTSGGHSQTMKPSISKAKLPMSVSQNMPARRLAIWCLLNCLMWAQVSIRATVLPLWNQ